MNSVKYIFLLSIILFLLTRCVVQKKLVIEEPQEGKCLLVGAVLIENNGLEDFYQAVTKNITVVISSKPTEPGDSPAGYRVKTDEHGYYVLQNVPPGAYVIKGFEADLGYETRLMVSSRWDGNTQVFYPTSGSVEYTVRNWPAASGGPVINMNIQHFVIDQAQRISNNEFRALNNTRLALPDQTYNLPDPVSHFKHKYPDWKWFEMTDE